VKNSAVSQAFRVSVLEVLRASSSDALRMTGLLFALHESEERLSAAAERVGEQRAKTLSG
jgi:hypothetical protein